MNQTKEILYIEDQIKEEEEFPRILRSHGYGVDMAESADDALRKLRDRGAKYSLIVLDIMMAPGEEIGDLEDAKGGFETGVVLLRKLRKELKLDTPVLILTAYGKPEAKVELRRYGISEFIGKPISPSELVEYIKKYAK